VEEGLKAEVLLGASSSGRRRSWTIPTTLGIRGGENAAEKRAENQGRQSSPKGINDGGGLAKSDEVERFPMPSTDEEDAGKGVLAGWQLTTDDWLVRGRIGKRRRWSHTAQQHSMVGENGVVGWSDATSTWRRGRGLGRRALRQGRGGPAPTRV
jgi:hypothetical protein